MISLIHRHQPEQVKKVMYKAGRQTEKGTIISNKGKKWVERKGKIRDRLEKDKKKKKAQERGEKRKNLEAREFEGKPGKRPMTLCLPAAKREEVCRKHGISPDHNLFSCSGPFWNRHFSQ